MTDHSSDSRPRATLGARTPFRFHRFVGWMLSLLPLACQGNLGPDSEQSQEVADPHLGSEGQEQPAVTPHDWRPVEPCEPRALSRVSRLSDRHLANSIADLLHLEESPNLQTSTSSTEQFLVNKPAPVSGAVGLMLRDLVEGLSGPATSEGSAFVQCSGDERQCARSFIDEFASRAFRRPIEVAERDGLLDVYDVGVEQGGDHQAGIRLLIEAVLQAPSFIYQTELGDSSFDDSRLTSFELASKLSFFLHDGPPDDELWAAAREGRLETADEIHSQVARLLERKDVRENITTIFARLFELPRLASTTKADEVEEFSPDLVASMQEETRRFIDSVLWERGGSLDELLVSTESFVDANLAELYGLDSPAGDGFTPVQLPQEQRAGILTQASLLTMHALPAESSVVHRGVFLVRELLCFHPPPPPADFVEQGEALKEAEHTERARSEARSEITACAGCHASFDPFGISFEHYDTLGRYRHEIGTPDGSVAVDASWDFDLFDVHGHHGDAVALANSLAQSQAVRQCMTRQLASYALGQRVTDAQACTIGDLSREFSDSGADLVDLIRRVATWPGLRMREAEQ